MLKNIDAKNPTKFLHTKDSKHKNQTRWTRGDVKMVGHP